MVALLDHNDHRKAGRALAICSISQLLISQCSSGFTTTSILGLNVHLTDTDLVRAFSILMWIYFVIFVVRIRSEVGANRWHSFVRERKSEAETRMEEINDLAALQHKNLETHVRSRMKNRGFSEKPSDLLDEETKRRNEIQGERETAIRAQERRYPRLAVQDFGMLWITEVLPPLLIFGATFINVQPLVCSSFSPEPTRALIAPTPGETTKPAPVPPEISG